MYEVPSTPAPFCPDNQTPMKTIQHLFTIQQVSERCGVSKSTLRFWERRFRAHIYPDRSKGGQRRYTAADVAMVGRIQQLKAEGLSLDEIGARLSSGRLDEAFPARPSLDHLAQRIAGLVREEIYQYLQQAERAGAVRGADQMPLHNVAIDSVAAVCHRD